jgi:hypothetical protein
MKNKLAKLTSFLDRLDEADIFYTLTSIREGAIGVNISVPGERWEVEFLDDGDVEVEVYLSEGELRDFDSVESLFE